MLSSAAIRRWWLRLKSATDSYIGAGSVITDPVPAEALALGRARQVIKEGWAAEKKEEEIATSWLLFLGRLLRRSHHYQPRDIAIIGRYETHGDFGAHPQLALDAGIGS